VHHKDGDPSNNMFSNLVLCSTQAGHMNNHATTYRSDTHKQCTVCHKIKTRSEFSLQRKRPSPALDPHDTQCKTCRVKAQRKRRSESK
jgi:hypothetical protein